MSRVIPIASGKGGVGKSFLTVNLGLALASRGNKVLLVDLDLGASNLHTLLGMSNKNPGLGHYLKGEVDSLKTLVIPTPFEGLFLIPGDALLTGVAQQNYFKKIKLLKELSALKGDYLLLDLGAGSANNVVDYYLPFPRGIIVTVPETTAILNAYSFMKNLLARAIYQSFPAHSAERKVIEGFFTRKLEGSGETLLSLGELLGRKGRERTEKVHSLLRNFHPGVVINMAGRSGKEGRMGKNLQDICQKNLGISLEYLATLQWREGVSRSVSGREPYFLSHPGDSLRAGIEGIATRIEDPEFYGVPPRSKS